MSTDSLRWRVVLVRPRNPLNIGAAARAMANFGFKDLVVVDPYGPVWRETRSAVGAEDIIRTARAVGSVAEAVSEVTLVVGATSGQRRTLDRQLVSLDELPAWIKKQELRVGRRGARPAAILFGSEKTGLSNENMSYCHVLVRIPTLPRCPSMNLGQAVAVCCYEIARIERKTINGRTLDRKIAGRKIGEPEESNPLHSARTRISPPATIQSIEHIFERVVRVLDHAGYLKPQSRATQVLKLRRGLIERRLSSHDAKLLGGMLAQIEWKLGHP